MIKNRVHTTCTYCGAGCELVLKVRDGRIVGVLPGKSSVNQGRLCIKGWSAHEFIYHPDRLTTPLIKKNGQFREAGWDEALSLVAMRLAEIRERHGPDALGVLASAKCTNEENYLLQKFARTVLGTNNIDHCARLCHSPTVIGLVATFGSGAMTNSIADIEGADVIFVIGSNTTEQHPLIARRIVKAVRERESQLVVADPRSIDLAGFAAIHIRQRPGTDVALINGMMHVILADGLEDVPFIEARTEGFEALRETVERYDPEYVEGITGVPAEDIRRAAWLYGGAERATIVYAMGITQHISGVDNVIALADLAMLTGNVGKEGSGVNPLRGHNNVQGACDMGALPNYLPGYQRVDDRKVRERFEAAWLAASNKQQAASNLLLPAKAGLTVTEMIDAAGEGSLKALYIMGENPMLSDPDINHVQECLSRLALLVVQDIFLSETAELAHVVLPGTSFAEKDGTFTSTERRVQRVRKAIEPIGDGRADWHIICQLATRMGYPMEYGSPAQIMDEIAALAPIYGGIRYERLEEKGLQWPCLGESHPGTPYLHEEVFACGRGRFTAVEHLPPAEQPDADYPFLLTTGRVLFHWHTGTMTRRSPTLNAQLAKGYVELNPCDAQRLGIVDGEVVGVRSRRGAIEIAARVTEVVPPGMVFIPFHFAESPANALTIAALNPKAKIPEYKVCAVRIEKLRGGDESKDHCSKCQRH